MEKRWIWTAMAVMGLVGWVNLPAPRAAVAHSAARQLDDNECEHHNGSCHKHHDKEGEEADDDKGEDHGDHSSQDGQQGSSDQGQSDNHSHHTGPPPSGGGDAPQH